MLAKQDKTYTYEEYLKFCEKERCEFINGIIYMMTSPTPLHQSVVLNIGHVFKDYFKDKDCVPFISPLDVTFTDEKNNKHTVQPDLFVVCDKDKLKQNKYEGVPTLIVEVVSPSNSSYDYVKKLDLYSKFGVTEYWIINPTDRNAICYLFENKTKPFFKTYSDNEVIESKVFDGLCILLDEVL